MILSIFPAPLLAFFESSILRRAQLKDRVELKVTDLRPFGEGAHKVVDDTPFGGGQGMLFKPDVVNRALEAELEQLGGDRSQLKVIFTTPRGIALRQPWLEDLAGWLGTASQVQPRKIVIVCGRYEGVDERVLEKWVDLEVSLGDFILTGGEIAALALSDALVRLLPGVLNDARSSREDSFSNGLLEHAHYTKPRDFEGRGVPEVLLGGNHREIEKFKLSESLAITYALRPDLIEAHSGEGLPDWAAAQLKRLKQKLKSP